MTFAVFGILSIIVCWRWGDWRHWKLYYPTILFLLIGDLVADILLYNKPLFTFGSLAEQYSLLDISVMLLLYPSTVILYLSFLPKTASKQVLYILMWVAIYSGVELVASFTGGMAYHNGWEYWHSVLFYVCMFPLLLLHYKKPLLVWPISALLCFAMLWWFRIPLGR